MPYQLLPTQWLEVGYLVSAKAQFSTSDGCTGGRSQYRTILITDIENYSAQYRTDAIRARLRAQLRRLMIASLSDTGIDGAHYTMDSTGDGWLVAIDPAVGKPRVLGPVVDRLGAGLRQQNRQVDMPERLRVRLVLHAGDVLVDQDGHFGDQLNFAFRLLEAQELRDLLGQASGPLLVCVSDAVYQQVIAQRHEGLDPAAFEAVWLKYKEVPRLGWVHAPGESGLAARTGLLALDVQKGIS